MVLRPQNISNSAEVIRRLGIKAINTAIEFDIYGNVKFNTYFRNLKWWMELVGLEIFLPEIVSLSIFCHAVFNNSIQSHV
jgi:acetyl-CoA hydrolase/succinyl-CoA:acetate CoA-transferase